MDLPPPQIVCIQQAVYSEARGESERGQRAVAHVIINRTKSGRFPKTPCAVVRQSGQFTYKAGSGKLWERVKASVASIGKDPTGGALYFKAKRARASWPHRLVATIGNHLFYK